MSIGRRLNRLRLIAAGLPTGLSKEFYAKASFWRPARRISSAWFGHAPFAFWLVATHRPRTIVELGTHSGYSFLCFCQAIERLGYPARAYAVDTWTGDEHSGFYTEDVLQKLRSYHEPRYGKFSRLIKARFDDALHGFDDASIDLLHIDGRHYYEDAKHDFQQWRTKLSDRAIVLFHDTSEFERGFGVFQLWSELSREAPAFEFAHSHGLGVLGWGRDLSPSVSRLLQLAPNGDVARDVRTLYKRLGATC